MGSNRNHADRLPSGPDGANPRMLGEAQVDSDKEAARRKLAGPETQTSPRAGRTGGLGTRAERPSENRHRQPTQKQQPQPGRSSKAPSAKGRTADEPGEKLPQAARDSTP